MTTATAARPPATMTARMVVMMTPEEKHAISLRARDLDMTPSEMLRRAGRNYDAALEDAALESLATQLEQSNAELRQQLDEVMTRVDQRQAEIERMRAAANNERHYGAEGSDKPDEAAGASVRSDSQGKAEERLLRAIFGDEAVDSQKIAHRAFEKSNSR